MNVTDDLFAYARRTDPETSHEAAKQIEPQLPHLEAVVLAAIALAPDVMTIDELAAALPKLDKVTISPRIKPLCNKGKIYSDGSTRAGRSGRPGLVWRIR